VIPPNEGYQVNDPTCNEVNNIIIKLKWHRAPGPDNILAELLKNGGVICYSEIRKLLLILLFCICTFTLQYPQTKLIAVYDSLVKYDYCYSLSSLNWLAVVMCLRIPEGGKSNI
jgi:hypothetical protein